MGGVELQLDGEGTGGGRFVPYGERRGLLRRRADVGSGTSRGAAHRGVPRDVVLHRDLAGPRRVAVRVRAGQVVAGDQDHRDAVLGDNGRVQHSLARACAVEPHAGDRVGEVGVREDPFRTGAGVVADEGDAVDIAVLDPLHHGE